MDEIARRLRQSRKALGLRAKDVYDELGESPGRWGNYETGVRMPHPIVMARYANRFGITTDWVYRGVMAGLPHDVAKKISEMIEAGDEAIEEVTAGAGKRAARRPPAKL